MTSRPRPKQQAPVKKAKGGGGPVAFFVALFIIALGAIQLISTFHTYALNLAELNALKKQEASLIAQKQELENNIERWDDDAYVIAQARERLGFVFSGETPIKVEHPEAVTGETSADAQEQGASDSESTLPWYSELAYSLREADTHKSAESSQGEAGQASSGASASPSGSSDPSADSGE